MNGNSYKDGTYSNGGILYIEASMVAMRNCHSVNNIASNGGGITSVQSTVVIKGTTTISQNDTIVPCMMQTNQASGYGGFLVAIAYQPMSLSE
jgi:hypothetical protein